VREDSRLAWKVKAQMTRFAGRLTEGQGEVERRFVGEMLYGMQAARDVKLSEISRALHESIALIKTENRLSRNLAAKDRTEGINRRLAWEGAGQVKADTVLAVDLGDLVKKYAKSMEHLATVRDGSEKELGEGYWLCQVVAADVCGDQVTPLYGALYSVAAEDFKSENEEIFRAMRLVSEATQKRGIFAIDRGGDRREILHFALENGLRFVIRQRGDRHVLARNGQRLPAGKAAWACRRWDKREVILERDGERVKKTLRVGAVPARLPERPETPLWLVVIRGLAEHPILLLTNVAPKADAGYALWIGDIYLTRWKCEEAYRFLKQAYALEDVRVRSYAALRSLYALLNAVFYFVSVILGAKAKRNLIFKKVCEKAKRFYEIATFYQYALADGLHRLLFATRHSAPPPPPPSKQLLLDFAKPPN